MSDIEIQKIFEAQFKINQQLLETVEILTKRLLDVEKVVYKNK